MDVKITHVQYSPVDRNGSPMIIDGDLYEPMGVYPNGSIPGVLIIHDLFNGIGKDDLAASHILSGWIHVGGPTGKNKGMIDPYYWKRKITVIFFLVDYESFNVQDANRIIDALAKAAAFQRDHSLVGVLTYHFSRPSPCEPTKLRFFEIYTNDKAFWEHAAEPSVMQGLSITFDPAVRKSFTWRAIYIGDVSQKVKETLITMGGYEILPIFSFFDGCLGITEKDTGILCFIRTRNKETIRSALESISPSMSINAIYHFLFQDPNGDLHMVTLWPGIDSMRKGIGDSNLKPVSFDLLQIYARKENHDDIKDIITPWKPELYEKPEAGYWMHPKL